MIIQNNYHDMVSYEDFVKKVFLFVLISLVACPAPRVTFTSEATVTLIPTLLSTPSLIPTLTQRQIEKLNFSVRT
jgi:hypothetical protein